MRVGILFSACLFLFSTEYSVAQNAPNATTQGVTVAQIDAEIAHLQKDIDRFKGLENMYQQQADLVEFRDYNGYKDAANLANKCQDIVNAMSDHVKMLEKEKAMLLQSNGTKQESLL